MDGRSSFLLALARALPIALLALCALTAFAQLPGITPKIAAPKAAASAEAEERVAPDGAAVRKLLVAAQAELARVVASPNQAIDAPPEATASQLLIRVSLLRQVVRAYQQRLDDMLALSRVRDQREATDERLERFRVDPARKPYSMVEVEALRREVQASLRQIEATSARIESIESQAEVARGSAQRAEQAARRLLERIEKREGPVGMLIWERDLQLLRSRMAVASLDTLLGQRSLREEELALARSDLAFLQTQLKVTEGRVEFTEKDRDALIGGFDARLKTLEPELAAALAAGEVARKAVEETRSRLATARARAEGKGGEREAVERLERATALAELRYATAQSRTNVVRLMLEMSEAQRTVWGYWYDIVRSKDSDTARQLNAILDNYREAIGKIDVSTHDAFRLTLSEISGTERQLAVEAAGPEGAFLREKIQTLRERAEWQSRLLADVLSAEDLLDRWRAGFAAEAGQTSGALRLKYWWHEAGVVGRAVWNFELFTAEDTIEVEGRKLVAERSVTLGKVASAVLIFVVGLWLARRVIDALSRAAVRFLRADARAAGLAGKWVFALIFAILFMLSLMTVKIPFTVFAFLGGAVAIGVGFGMQTLLKNLISGMMLLVERPFRLGDVVEVGGIRGTVTDINVRSSLIRDRNGIETLVPNSTFLEQNVTNWTYTESRVRYSVNVGVAYGSPVDRVRDLLLEEAGRHGLVLRNPEPEVYFEDFASDALNFSLQYWLDLPRTPDSRRVASDLRYMIEKSFTEAGIAIAFPQRDVHLDASRPIPVQVVAGTDGGGR